MAPQLTVDEITTIVRLDKQGCAVSVTQRIMQTLRELASAQRQVMALQLAIEDMIVDDDIEADVLVYQKMYIKD